MTDAAIIPILELLLGIVVLLWFFWGPWQSILVDITRQRLFEIRDSLFLMAADGRLDFDSEVYRELRKRLNLSIRFCHNARFSRLLAATVVKSDVVRRPDSWSIIEKIEDMDLRKDLEMKAAESALYLGALMFLRSPVLLISVVVLTPLIMFYELLTGGIKRLLSWFGKTLERDIDLDARRPA